MKAAMMALLALVAPVAQGAAVSPIGKVVEMISDLQSKVIKEGEEAQKIYAEFAEWCEDRSKELGFEIKTGKAEVADLKAIIEEETATQSALTTKVEELSASIAEDEEELKAATKIREKENKDFVAEEKELMEVLDMLERAIGILEREMQKSGASMLQMKNVQSIAQALDVMLKASLIGQADATKLAALVQTTQGSEDEELGAPEAATYEGHSSGILDTMGDLSDKAKSQLDEARNKEESAQHNFDMLKQSLTDEIKFANKDMDEAKKGLAASAEKKSTAEGELTTTSKALSTDVEAKAELHHDCMTKAEDFEVETKDRAEELKALAEAKKIITEMTSGADKQSYSFVQVSSKSKMQLANFEVVRLVRDLARKHQSRGIAMLATRMDNVMRTHSGEDVFAKIRGMVSDMISKLEEEAEADATKKAYCDKEMGETEAKKADKEDEIEKLSTKIEEMDAESAKLKEEVATTQKELSDLLKSQAEMDKLREEENTAYKKNKAEMEMGLEGVKKALSVLKDYYGKKEGGSGAGEGIIGLLEVCESDFSKDLATIVSTEEEAAATYESESKENEIEKTTKDQDIKYKTKEAASLDKAVAETTSDKDSVQAELDAVLEYYKKIQGECVAKAETYEEIKKRRTEEIAGLKTALQVLEEETAFVQEHSSRRALRGVSPHKH